MTDNLLISLRNGDRSAFASLHERYFGQLYNFCRKYLHDRTEAEDIVQETFIAVWENRGRIDPQMSIRAYLISIAKNKIFDHIKHRFVEIRHRAGVEESLRKTMSDEESLLWDDIVAVMLRTIEGLPARQREILTLRSQGYSNHEIGERLSISPRTVETHVSRSMASLRAMLGTEKIVLAALFFDMFS
jgi:RNA polymerase sigma-70 factor (ECF subfamily)